MRSRVVVGALLTVITLLGARANAHDETVSASTVEVTGKVLTWKVDVGMVGLHKAVALPVHGEELSASELQATKPAIAEYLQRCLTVSLDGRVVVARVGVLEPIYEPSLASGTPYIARAVLTLEYIADDVDGFIDAFTAHVAFFAELTAQHRAVITVRWGGGMRQIARLGVAELALDRAHLDPSPWASITEFFLWGTHHIFKGYDHIAFLLALLLVATRVREVVTIVTAFTVAHSLTLLLAAFEVVRIPSRITEALIAASIVYVAADNLLRKRIAHRAVLTFAFGLVHGLGFAGELRARLGELPGNTAVPVLSFNLGVELGQLALVLLIMPLLEVWRRAGGETGQHRRQGQLVRFGSLPILVLGIYWLVARMTE